MPRLTEYELQRQENIRRNQDLLKSLGIPQAQASLVVKKLVCISLSNHKSLVLI